ncbi:MAG TPA: undecaprenyl-phosphate glucose phosphotransferase, partial [Myxococcales bacterium]
MFGRFQHFYTSVKVATDVVVLALAFGLAYATVFWALGRPAPPLENSLVSLIMVLTIFPLTFRQARLYATNRSRTHIGEVFEIFKATITGALIIVALTYFMRERYSRLTYAIFLSYAFLMLSATRLGAREILNEIRRRGYNLKTILLIGTGSL